MYAPYYAQAKIKSISSDTHHLHAIPLHHLTNILQQGSSRESCCSPWIALRSVFTPELRSKYRTLRNYVNNLREHLRKEHYANVIFENQNSPGKLWKVIKQMMGASKSCLASGDKFVSNTKEIVNSFNTFFSQM